MWLKVHHHDCAPIFIHTETSKAQPTPAISHLLPCLPPPPSSPPTHFLVFPDLPSRSSAPLQSPTRVPYPQSLTVCNPNSPASSTPPTLIIPCTPRLSRLKTPSINSLARNATRPTFPSSKTPPSSLEPYSLSTTPLSSPMIPCVQDGRYK